MHGWLPKAVISSVGLPAYFRPFTLLWNIRPTPGIIYLIRIFNNNIPYSMVAEICNVHFRRATPGEKILCWTRNYASWGGVHTEITQYINREVVNSSAGITRDGQQKHWVLSDRPDPPQDGEETSESILAACETLERPAVVVGKDGELEKVKSVGIASVYTAPEKRGKGYARIMMRRLGEWLDQENVTFSVLFSDVGKSFYDERGGWKPFPSDEVLIEVGNTSSNCQNGIRDDLQLLRKDDIAQICSLDVSLMQAEVIKRPLGKGIAVRAAVLPGYDLALWYFGSEEYTGKIATGKSPEIKGAKAGDVAIYWIHEFKRRQLMILRVVDLKIRSNDDSTLTEENRVQSLASVLAAGVKEAKEWDLGAVVVWNPDEGVKKAAEILGRDMDGVKPVVWERDTDNFPALRWKQEDNAGKVEWWCVEKYTWC